MEVTAIPAAPDRITALAEETLRQAFLADTAIAEVILPALPLGRRLSAERVLRMIAARQLFRDGVHDEIEALLRLVDQEVAAGSHQVFRPHEADPSHGHVETVRDDRSEALATAADTLRSFSCAIAECLTAMEAQKIVFEAFAAD